MSRTAREHFPPSPLSRTEQRQMARALGWRGSKTTRHRKERRADFAPQRVKDAARDEQETE